MSRGRKNSQEGVHGLQLCAPFHQKDFNKFDDGESANKIRAAMNTHE